MNKRKKFNKLNVGKIERISELYYSINIDLLIKISKKIDSI